LLLGAEVFVFVGVAAHCFVFLHHAAAWTETLLTFGILVLVYVQLLLVLKPELSLSLPS
jgi:hypothetical protein